MRRGTGRRLGVGRGRGMIRYTLIAWEGRTAKKRERKGWRMERVLHNNNHELLMRQPNSRENDENYQTRKAEKLMDDYN
jgi:hypothetical protein